jgi:hypothetical protein
VILVVVGEQQATQVPPPVAELLDRAGDLWPRPGQAGVDERQPARPVPQVRLSDRKGQHHQPRLEPHDLHGPDATSPAEADQAALLTADRPTPLVQVSAGVDGLPPATNPNVVCPLAATGPLYAALRTVIVDPLVVCVPFQTWLMVWPAARPQLTAQPLIGAVPALTVTSPWKPPDQEFIVR